MPRRSVTQAQLFWLACLAWTIVVVCVFGRILVSPHKNDLFATYQQAGRSWINGQSLYATFHGFIYTPLIAAFFAPFSFLPLAWGAVLWRLINAAVFLFSVNWWIEREVHPGVNSEKRGLILLLLLPLTIGNLNNGQVNLLMIGLIMAAALATRDQRWMLAAVCVAICTYFKIYPLAVGLLLAVVFPRPLLWRLVLCLTLLGACSLILQRPEYVFEQYQRWWESRQADPRRYQIDVAPRDLWMLCRALHLPITEKVYLFVQLGAAAILATICFVGVRRNWSLSRLVIATVTLGCCWMLLLGPSTESATYVVLSPMLVLALVSICQGRNVALWLRCVVLGSYLILLAALGINSFLNLDKTVYLMAVQPLGTLLFFVGTLFWLLRDSHWPEVLRAEPSALKVPR
jgi:Glycosyltransferase family 87